MVTIDSIKHQSISARMALLGTVAAIGFAVSAGSAFWTTQRLIQNQTAIAANGVALQKHALTDMYHDRVSALVYAAFSYQDTGLSPNEIKSEAKHAYEQLTRLNEEMATLDLPADIHAQLRDASAALKSFIKSGELIVDIALVDKSAAKEEIRSFETKFKELEGALADLGDNITAHSDQTRATSEAFSKQAILAAIATFLALLALMTWVFFSLRNNFVTPLQKLNRTMSALAEGDTNVDFPNSSRRDELGDMTRAVKIFRENTASRDRLQQQANQSRSVELVTARQQQEFLSLLTDGLSRMAAGDLSVGLPPTSSEIHQVAVTDFNSMTVHLSEIVSRIGSANYAVQNSTAQIADDITDLSARTEQQASSLEETAASMEEIAATVRQNADNAQEANQLAAAARQLATQGAEVALRTGTAMDRIEDASRQVSDIVGMIQEIAFQTNILALNAAVEAARAGEAGKGFAVVANEVRALAQRSASASKEIKQLISSTDASVTEGVELARQTGTSLNDITNAVRRVADIVSEIAAASKEQSAGIDQVSRAISNMDELTQQNAELVERTNASLNTSKLQIVELQDAVSFFSIAKTMSAQSMALPPLPRAEAVQHHVKSAGFPGKLRDMAKKMADTGKPHAPAKPAPRKAAINSEWNEF